VTPPTFSEAFDLSARRIAVGLSGGADSTYLSILASRANPDALVLVHINHELRSRESDADEAFCRTLATRLNRPLVVARRSQIEPTLTGLPTNPSARYRAIRLHVFRHVTGAHALDAVLLAHHADDQAETVLLRLARGGGLHALRGMRGTTRVQGVTIERPLLHTRAADIRSCLREMGQAWREDSSNASSEYRRNVARQILARDPSLSEHVLRLASHASRAVDALDAAAPVLEARFPCQQLAALPSAVAEQAARRWLLARGSPVDDVSPDVCRRLIRQASDPSSPLRQHFPGRILVRRRKKHLDVLSCEA
jgi:tRNA(Ile)-lysidine synthase